MPDSKFTQLHAASLEIRQDKYTSGRLRIFAHKSGFNVILFAFMKKLLSI